MGTSQGKSVPTSLLLTQADRLWDELQRLGDSLTDEEMFWEPTAGCWSIRPQPDGSRRFDWSPSPPVAPFTTIAWRLEHIGQSLASHAKRLFEHGSFTYATYEPGADLEGSMRFLKESFNHWRTGIAAAGETIEEDLALEVIDFNIHHLRHLAEIHTIRDLYRWQGRLDSDPFVEACLRGDVDRLQSLWEDDPDPVSQFPKQQKDLVLLAALMGRWNVLRPLLERGFPVESGEGPTALHYASSFAPLDAVQLLVEHGADVDRLDPEWNSTPLGWAEFFGRIDTAEYLRSLAKRK
jgi:hypothetical protein